MLLPEYITIDEVRRICRELKISDWTSKGEPGVSPEEALIILSAVNTEGMNIPLNEFQRGLEVELEHGLMYKEANVTNNHPVLTAKIVLAHLKETMDYYKRLDIAELEADLFKATLAGDPGRAKKYLKRLTEARRLLNQVESDQIG
jgi:Protein of unknown function (DUF5661)